MKALVSIVVFVAAGAAGWWFTHPSAFERAPAVADEAVGAAYIRDVESVWSQAWSAAYQLQVAAGYYVQAPDDQRRQELIAAWYAAEQALLTADWYSALFVPGQDRHRMLAWPLDEGEIDYVDEATYRPVGDNPYATANFVRNEAILNGRAAFRMKPLRPKYLRHFADTSDMPGHAPSGLYALEFLIWGQDGHRPDSDYARTEEDCTTKPGAKQRLRECERRIQILVLTAQVLTEDVQRLMLAWTQQQPAFIEELGTRVGLERMVGSWIDLLQHHLGSGALAIEDEQQLPHEFSGTPQRYFQALFGGLAAVYSGREGAGLRDWLMHDDPAAARRIDELLTTLRKVSEAPSAQGPRAWLVGGAAQRPAAEAANELVGALQALRERLQEPGQPDVMAGGQ